eukprot:Skav231720  [mRNA]  locus=scaffold2515:94487:95347:- [translate_table: standard]
MFLASGALAKPQRQLDGDLNFNPVTEAPEWATGKSADEVCHDTCKSQGFCCNDWSIGSNQYISCAQACMMRHRGRTLEGVRSLCGDQQCVRNVDNFEYGFCSQCLDLTDSSICRWGVADDSACQAGAQLEICQADLAGKVVTVYDVSKAGFLAVGDVDSSGQRTLQYVQDSSDPTTHWQMSSEAGGWTLRSISHPFRYINAWDLRDCAQQAVSAEDSEPVHFNLESLSFATFQSSSLICGTFSWTVIIETIPSSSFLCTQSVTSRGSFWLLSFCVGIVLFSPTILQ